MAHQRAIFTISQVTRAFFTNKTPGTTLLKQIGLQFLSRASARGLSCSSALPANLAIFSRAIQHAGIQPRVEDSKKDGSPSFTKTKTAIIDPDGLKYTYNQLIQVSLFSFEPGDVTSVLLERHCNSSSSPISKRCRGWR